MDGLYGEICRLLLDHKKVFHKGKFDPDCLVCRSLKRNALRSWGLQ